MRRAHHQHRHFCRKAEIPLCAVRRADPGGGVKIIHKYTLNITKEQMIEMPKGAHFLSAQMQRGKLCVWAIVERGKLNYMESFVVLGTGQPVPEDQELEFLGTVQEFDGKLVWHIFRAAK